MRNVFAYLAAASVVSVAAPMAPENSELKLFRRLAVFHEQLLSSGERRTNPRGIADSVRRAKEQNEEFRTYYARALTFAELLEKASSRGEQEFLYAELCASVQNLAPKFRLHAFYCPQTKKVWIGQREEVQNPYVSSERNNGVRLS